jgi:hypothetical protein
MKIRECLNEKLEISTKKRRFKKSNLNLITELKLKSKWMVSPAEGR